jgi:hypothetical protein
MKYDDKAYEQLSGELRINRDEIDEELIAQAQHFWHVAEAHEQAVSAMDRRKFDLDTLEVELDKDIREQMAADEEKITEKLVEAAIKREQVYQRAVKAYLEAKRDAGRWSSLRESFRHRRDMLLEVSRRAQQRATDSFMGAGEVREARNRYDERRRRV